MHRESDGKAEMKVIYFTQFYPPESTAAAFRAHEHARYWSKGNNAVTVFTGYPNYPTGKVFDGYQISSLEQTEDEKVRLLRSRIIAMSNKSFLGRIVNGLSFSFFGMMNFFLRGGIVGTDYDVVFASSGPIFTVLLGSRFAKRNKLPLVVEFRDLSYAQLVATGASEDSLKVRLMKKLEVNAAKKADRVIALTHGFKSLLEKAGVSGEKVFVVPNGADPHLVAKIESHDDDVHFGYFGTMGLSQDVHGTLDLISSLVGLPEIEVTYTLIGEGAERETIEQELADGKYCFARLLHGLPQNELEKYYGECDFTIVSLKNSDSFAATIPSKIFQSFARGVPVIFIGPEGEAANLIREADAGVALCGSPEENEAKLKEFFLNENYHDNLKAMGNNAIKLVEESYSREKLASQVLRVLEDLVERSEARD